MVYYEKYQSNVNLKSFKTMTKKTIAFQGSAGANSNLACNKFYPDLEAKSLLSFRDVFDAVKNGEVDCGIIPLENSSAGRVPEIYTLLQEAGVYIVAEHFLRVEHNLVGILGANLTDIKEVYSHPQALMQSRDNLENLGVTTCSFSNTADAAKFVSSKQDITKAALCSKMAAEVNGLTIIKEDMQDSESNATVFILIEKNAIDPDPKTSAVMTFLMFTIKNYPGSLYSALGSFAENDVGMMQIESFIRGGSSKQAAFFVMIEGHHKENNVVLALGELKKRVKEFSVLGSYYADKSRFN